MKIYIWQCLLKSQIIPSSPVEQLSNITSLNNLLHMLTISKKFGNSIATGQQSNLYVTHHTCHLCTYLANMKHTTAYNVTFLLCLLCNACNDSIHIVNSEMWFLNKVLAPKLYLAKTACFIICKYIEHPTWTRIAGRGRNHIATQPPCHIVTPPQGLL